MTTEVSPDGTTQAVVLEQNVETKIHTSIEDAMVEIEKLRGINKEVIATRDKEKSKLRSFEKEQEQREQALLADQGKFKELYEKRENEFQALQTTLKTKAVDSALKDVLHKAGARSVDTVAKLIDKSKIGVSDDFNAVVADIESQIEELKKTDPILFGIAEGVNPPSVKRPSDGTPTAGIDAELRACKTVNEIQAVMKKYGKL